MQRMIRIAEVVPPTTTAVDNGGNPEDSAKERGAYYDDDLSNPNHPLHRPAPEQAVQP